MSFLNPALLWAFALAGIPLIIHLVNRWRHKTVRWAAMEMLLRAAQKSRGARRLRHWLILLFRVLALLALAAVVVRPLLGGGWMGIFGSERLDAVIVLLDRSPSMERTDPATGRTLREKALSQLVDTLEKHRSDSRIVLIDSATGQPLTLANAGQLERVPQTGASDAPTDLSALLNQAAEIIEEEGIGSAEIWIASDLQESSWRPAAGAWQSATARLAALPQPPPLRLLAEQSGQISDSTLQLVDHQRREAEVQLEYEIERLGGEQPTTLLVNAEGNRYEETLPPFESQLRSQLDVPVDPDQERGWIELALPADAAPANSHLYTVFGSNLVRRSAFVGPTGTATAEATRLALAPPGVADLEVADRSDPARLDFGQLGLVVWQGPLPKSEKLRKQVEAYLDAGGQLLLLPPGEPADDRDFLGFGWGEVQDAPPEGYLEVTPSLSNRGVLEDFRDGTPFSLDRTLVIRRQAPVAEQAEALIRYQDGTPFLSRLAVGERGTIHALSTLPDFRWSDLSDQPEFLVLLDRLLASGSRRLSDQLVGSVGLRLPPVPEPARWEWRNRQGEWTPVTGNRPLRAGIYRAGERLAALNVPIAELQPAALDEAALETIFGDLEFELFARGAGQTGGLTREAWMIAALALIALLLGEALLSLPSRPRLITDPFAGLDTTRSGPGS